MNFFWVFCFCSLAHLRDQILRSSFFSDGSRGCLFPGSPVNDISRKGPVSWRVGSNDVWKVYGAPRTTRRGGAGARPDREPTYPCRGQVRRSGAGVTAENSWLPGGLDVSHGTQSCATGPPRPVSIPEWRTVTTGDHYRWTYWSDSRWDLIGTGYIYITLGVNVETEKVIGVIFLIFIYPL